MTDEVIVINQNSLIEIGSKANVVIRFKTKTKINGKEYEANEPFLILKEVDAWVSYANIDKVEEVGVKKITAHSSIKPTSVSIMGAPFTRKLCSLLSTFISTGSAYSYTKMKTLTSFEGVIYLPEEIDTNKPIFVYDGEYNKIPFVYNQESNSISSSEFIDSNDYLISFSPVMIGTSFSLNKPDLPYMTLEIQGVGNIDKRTKNVVLFFDKVSLNSIMEFNFIQDDRINVPLVFHILEGSNNSVHFED